MSEATEPPVLLRREGHAAHAILNRPKAINALTLPMVRILTEALDAWATDDEVQVVVLTGAGDRGLCAGGDITALYEDARTGGSHGEVFWAEEYRLDHLISTYPKPYVAVMDGLVLGGGVGVSAHAAHRVVTERSSIGVPETGIGFLPDVGSTWLLSHAPGETGIHLGLTAGSVGAGDAIAMGLADHYVPSENLPTLLEALSTKGVHEAIAIVEQPAPESPLVAARTWMDEAYAGDDLGAILARLREHEDEAARKAATRIGRNSPTALAVTLRALRQGTAYADLAEALDVEYRLALRFLAHHDFPEGIRAQVIDKDREPRWAPATLDEVDTADVDAFFAPLGDRELGLTGHDDGNDAITDKE